jgi:hypothetical protein
MPAGGERVFAERDDRQHRHGLKLHRDAARGQRACNRTRLIGVNIYYSLLELKAGHEKRSKQQADAQPEQ